MTNKNTATIYFRDEEKQFHLSNEKISYIFNVSTDGKLLQLYYGKAVSGK